MKHAMASMQHTSNLIDDRIKWVALVDLIYSLLGVIDHLICTQLLNLSSNVSDRMIFLVQILIHVLGTNRGPTDRIQHIEEH